jgi:hypothetical protein
MLWQIAALPREVLLPDQSSASRWELFDRKWPREYRSVPGHPRTTGGVA